MYRKILFCADLYASSDYAFASALDLAEQSGAELIILHVLESRHRYSGHVITEDGESWATAEVIGKLKKKLREYYLARIEKEDPQAVRVEVRAGIPWVEILRLARKEKVDLIVMGPYTIQDPERVTEEDRPHLGPNAQRVTLRAQCPVSIVTSPKQRLAVAAEHEEESWPGP